MRETNAKKLLDVFKSGRVYRRQEIVNITTSIDRDLKFLVNDGAIVKLAPGLYCKPKKSRFGTVPPEVKDAVRSFLKDDNFLLVPKNLYASLGLGLTQLYNTITVYNHKRFILRSLGTTCLDFRTVPAFPKKLNKEYLLVDLINNLRRVAEDADFVKSQVKNNLEKFDKNKIYTAAKKYGLVSTKKFFKELINEEAISA